MPPRHIRPDLLARPRRPIHEPVTRWDTRVSREIAKAVDLKLRGPYVGEVVVGHRNLLIEALLKQWLKSSEVVTLYHTKKRNVEHEASIADIEVHLRGRRPCLCGSPSAGDRAGLLPREPYGAAAPAARGAAEGRDAVRPVPAFALGRPAEDEEGASAGVPADFFGEQSMVVMGEVFRVAD